MKTIDIIVPQVLLPIDRSMHYRLPTWARAWHLSYRGSNGPERIDLGRLANFPEELGIRDRMRGLHIYERLQETGYIHQCLNYQTGIQISNYEYCYQLLRGRRIYLWQSVVYDDYNNLLLPYIQILGFQRPTIYWLWLEYRIDFSTSLVRCLDV